MTNTRLTDPEILETRYPVVLREFAIRQQSGGSGTFRGGHGILRKIEFRRPLTISLLTSRRNCQPFGLSGGGPGASGKNLYFCAASGETIQLESQCQFQVAEGDQLTLKTPGGGGYGAS